MDLNLFGALLVSLEQLSVANIFLTLSVDSARLQRNICLEKKEKKVV